MSELLPCPFCGSADVVIQKDVHGNLLWWAVCLQCDTSSGPFDSVDKAIAAWDTRAESPELAAALADRDRARQANEANSAGYLACADQRQAAERQLAAALEAVKRRDGVIAALTACCVCGSELELPVPPHCPDCYVTIPIEDEWVRKIKTKLEN